MVTALMCLATTIYFEARGEPLMGQFAVAQVVLNRVEDSRYPDTICGVVKDPNAFSYIKPKGDYSMVSYKAKYKALQVATLAISGGGIAIPSTHYHTSGIRPHWAKHFDLDGKIGSHIFYTNNTPYK